MALIDAAKQLSDAVSRLSFAPPVTHVYNPLDYAFGNWATYVQRYGGGRKTAVLLGMNPGPFGMVQTGIPFGDVATVGGWLAIRGEVGRPAHAHPKRPVLGLDCPRVEVSGKRLWGAIREAFGDPDAFFARFFVANYCPLAFVEASGRNRTPNKLLPTERAPLFAACDAHLRALVTAMRPKVVVGIGAFAEARAQAALLGTEVRVGRILHPSPASPAANRDWAGTARAQLAELVGCDAGAACTR